MNVRRFKGVMVAMIALATSIIQASEGIPSDTLRIYYPKMGLILDPHRMEDAYSMGIVLQIYRGLFRFTPQGEVVPDLAESWTVSPDHLRYVFKLKQDAKFSDGHKISAKNVQMSFARAFHVGASIGADLDYIAGVSEFRKTNEIKNFGVHVLSDSEVEFKLNHPSALFLKHLAVVDCSILPIESFDDHLNFAPSAAFSGPYRIKTDLNESGVVLEKWRADSLDSKNPPKIIQISLSNESPTLFAEKGLTDSLDHEQLKPEDVSKFQRVGWKNTPTEIIAETFVVLDPNRISFEIRQFLASRVDSKALLARIGVREFKAAFGLIPFGVAGYLDEKSKNHAVHSSLNLSKTVRIDVDYEEGNVIHEQIAKYLGEVWRIQNLDIHFNPVPRKEKLARMFAKKAQATIGHKLLDYPDGYSVLAYFKSGYPGNYFFLEDKVIDQSIGDLVKVFDEGKRESLYKEVQKQVLKHHTVIPLYFGTQASGLWGPRVATVPAHPMGFHTLPYETVEMK